MQKYVKGTAVLSVLLSMALLTGCGSKESGESTGGEVVSEQKENPVTANKTGIYELEGTVSKINTISNTFILGTAEGDVEVYVRAMSRVMVGGERTPLSSLSSGSYAKGTYRKFDGKDAVMEIVITPTKPQA